MRKFNKISSIVLALCMAISLFAVPAYATTPNADVKDAISFSGEITKAEDELQVNFAIPEGLSDIRGVQFYVEMPAGFTVSGVSTTLTGWQAHTGTLNKIILECGKGYQSLEELFPSQATNSYAVATLDITTDKATCGENGQKIAKVTVEDVTSGKNPVSNDGSVSVDVPFALNIVQCTAHTGGTATCVDYAVCDNCGVPYGDKNPNGHKYTNYVYNNNATCLKDGTKSAVCDNGCGTKNTVTATGTKKQHSYIGQQSVTPATLKADGAIYKKCVNGCNKSGVVSKIRQITSFKLEYTSTAYTGKTKEPKVTVKDAAGKTIASTNYTVTYSKNKSVGKATAKVVFKNNYSGTKPLTFKIVPKKTSISSLKASKKSFTVKYKKQTSGTGYEIQYSTSSKFKSAKTVKISKNKTVSKTVKKLKSKKTYYVRVRVTKGSSYKSSWSSVKKVKVK